MNKLQKTAAVITVCALMCTQAVTSCADELSESEFTETKLNVHLFSDDNVTEADIRFYNDLPQIPYIRLTDFYSLLMANEKQMSVSAGEDGIFTFTSATGATAVIDAAADTVYSEDYENFINTTIKKQDNAPNVYYDGAPFLRIAEVVTDKDPEPVNIDFSDYNIDLRAGEDDIWLPVLTASDMFSGVTMYHCVYDGTDLIFYDSNSDYSDFALLYSEAEFSDYVNKLVPAFIKDGKRSPVLAEYCYNELCFMFDTFYGYPGRSVLEKGISEKGLDKTLQTYDKFTAQAREWILSDDLAEATAGLVILAYYMDDGGHTHPEGIATPFVFADPDTILKAGDLIDSIGYEKKIAGSDVSSPKTELLTKLRTEAWNNEYLIISGDTAVISFDSFMFDFDGWKEYYKNGGDLPDDDVSRVKNALDKAKADPNVKNVVFDVSLNKGGSGDMLCLIEAFMTGRSFMIFKNELTSQLETIEYEADTNFDGVFDETDKIPYDFNFGVLTSDISFSCGNYFPARAHDLGFPVIGERSGGGACALLISSSPEGICYLFSSHSKLVSKDYESIDNGTPVDTEFFTVNDDGTYDYSMMYDINMISKAMNDFYSADSSVDGSNDCPDDIENDSDTDDKPAPADSNPTTGSSDMDGMLVLMTASAVLAVLTCQKNKILYKKGSP